MPADALHRVPVEPAGGGALSARQGCWSGSAARGDAGVATQEAVVRRRGRDLALLAFGSMVEVAEIVARQMDATVVNMRFIKPLDEAVVVRLAAEHRWLVTLEENTVAGGAGSAVNECLAARSIQVPVYNIGLPDRFVSQGERDELLAECGLDVEGVLRQLTDWG